MQIKPIFCQVKGIAIRLLTIYQKLFAIYTETKQNKVKNKNNILKILHFGPILCSGRAIPQIQ